ncbi:hypothetical protein PINS_up013462 [Pythium insidiosum]|nr:hypothetical protein PINS_up013462 [Pythium insidiosum]
MEAGPAREHRSGNGNGNGHGHGTATGKGGVAKALREAIAAVEAVPPPPPSPSPSPERLLRFPSRATNEELRTWDETLTLRLVLIWRSVCQEHRDADDAVRVAIIHEQLQTTAGGGALTLAAVDARLRAVLLMYQFVVRVSQSVPARRAGGLPVWFELSCEEKRALRGLHGVRSPDISPSVFVIIDSVLNPKHTSQRDDSKNAAIDGQTTVGETAARERPSAAASSSSLGGDLDHGEVVDFKRNWSEEVTMQLAKTWHRVAVESPDMRGAMLSQKVHNEFVAAVGGCSRSRKAIEDKMHAMKDMYRFIRLHEASCARGAKRQPWFPANQSRETAATRCARDPCPESLTRRLQRAAPIPQC